MILDTIREQVRTCGKSRYRICKETGLDQAALLRIMTGGGCKAETIDILFEYFGLKVIVGKKIKSKKRTRKG